MSEGLQNDIAHNEPKNREMDKVIFERSVVDKSGESYGHTFLDWEADYQDKDGKIIASAFSGNSGGPDNFADSLWVNGIAYSDERSLNAARNITEFADYAERRIEDIVDAQRYPYRVYALKGRSSSIVGSFATEKEANECTIKDGFRKIEIRRDALGSYAGNKPTPDTVQRTPKPFWKQDDTSK